MHDGTARIDEMAFHVRTRNGESIGNPDLETIDRVMSELDEDVDPEHPDVALSHESGWTLSAFPSGLVIWENVESDAEPRHRVLDIRQDLRGLWLALADGDLGAVEAFGWFPGHGPTAAP